MSFGVAFVISLSFWELFGYTFCIKKSIGAPKVPQEAPRVKVQIYNHHFGDHSGHKQISDMFKTCTFFVDVFPRRCFGHALLVYLCTFSEDFCIHFVFHVICARNDLDSTGMAQTHVLTSERSE